MALPPLILAVALAHSAPAVDEAPPVCGNGVVERNEECDDGGVCIGSPNAGAACTDAAQCPSGQCTTFGGHGCAANCTGERDVVFNLVSGHVDPDTGISLLPGTSGTVVHSQVLALLLPIGKRCQSGAFREHPCTADGDCAGGVCGPASMTLTIGKDRGDGLLPVVVKAKSVRFPRIDLGGLACGCLRNVAGKTCGGTVFNPDGLTQSLDCTLDDHVCDGKSPCTYVSGEGNSASGVIGCNGLNGVDFAFMPDCTGDGAPMIRFSGTGGPGSAVLFGLTAIITTAAGTCSGSDPSVYGPDGEFCTDDDPFTTQRISSSAPVVTGTATAQWCDIGVQGISEGRAIVGNCCGGPICALELPPCLSVTGAPFSCIELSRGSAAGACLVTAFSDGATPAATVLCAETEPSGSPAVTATPTSTPARTSSPTVTPSATTAPTRTASATSTPTPSASPTRTPSPTATRAGTHDSGCSVAARQYSEAGAVWVLVLPTAFLFWARRRVRPRRSC